MNIFPAFFLRDLKPEFRAKTTVLMVGELVMAEVLVGLGAVFSVNTS